jgi:hypothetical protein
MVSAPSDAWLASLQRYPAPSEPATDRVRLVGFPTALGMAQSERVADLLREFNLLVIGQQRADAHPVPSQLLELVNMLYANYSADLEGPQRLLEEAYQRGDPTVDLVYPAVKETRAIIVGYATLMEQVDEYCRLGDLLTLAATPDILALRRWTIEEFVRQYDGLPPRCWAECRERPE